MPRKARKNLVGKFHHIMVQGINKEYIFENNYYKQKYKNILKENTKEKDIEIIAYCIMSNHAHILAYTEDIKTMTKVMQKINTKYAMHYNKIKNRVGFVFRNRYNSQEIYDERHLKSCIAYIHRNPMEAKIVSKESQYRFSSYNEYMTKKELISENLIKIIFEIEDEEELRKAICILHMQNVNDAFIEISNDIDYNKILKKYKKEDFTDTQIVKKFKEDYNLSERKIAKIMNITRYQIMKLSK